VLAGQAIKGLSGKLEAFYFTLGDTDVFTIADAPDDMSAVAESDVSFRSGHDAPV
jgi:uncharacterized protein with GYD domain